MRSWIISSQKRLFLLSELIISSSSSRPGKTWRNIASKLSMSDTLGRSHNVQPEQGEDQRSVNSGIMTDVLTVTSTPTRKIIVK